MAPGLREHEWQGSWWGLGVCVPIVFLVEDSTAGPYHPAPCWVPWEGGRLPTQVSADLLCNNPVT